MSVVFAHARLLRCTGPGARTLEPCPGFTGIACQAEAEAAAAPALAPWCAWRGPREQCPARLTGEDAPGCVCNASRYLAFSSLLLGSAVGYKMNKVN